MKLKIALAALLVASIPLQGFGYTAYAQDAGATVDAKFLSQLEAALKQRPELVLEAAALAQHRQRTEETKRLSEKAEFVREELAQKENVGYVLGNPDGASTYIEFLDYRCGYCRRSHPEVEKLIEGNKDARFIVLMRPVLGPESETLARFAMAAGEQGKFHEAHAYLYENSVETTDDSMKKAAADLGLNWAKLQADMTGEVVTARLAEHTRIGDQLEVNGTPFFITPVRVVPGATTADDLASDLG